MSETQRKVDPDPTVEAFLHASALHGKRYNAVTYFVMRLLGLEVTSQTPLQVAAYLTSCTLQSASLKVHLFYENNFDGER